VAIEKKSTLMSNLDRLKNDLARLVAEGHQLLVRMAFDLYPNEVAKARQQKKEELEKELPAFSQTYQRWYSEALAILSVLLPDRVEDFRAYYQLPRPPKELDHSTYTISDYLKGTQVVRGGHQVIVDRKAAQIPMQQQSEIVNAAMARFDSSLFDIRGVVQADLFNNELDAADELNKHGFARGAGAIAGVVLEGHLATVCKNHSVSITKKKPTLSDYYEALKAANVIDLQTWRFIQHLGDIRNACDHKGRDPTKDSVADLIAGVRKISKTTF
jgi:hypothetical protein